MKISDSRADLLTYFLPGVRQAPLCELGALRPRLADVGPRFVRHDSDWDRRFLRRRAHASASAFGGKADIGWGAGEVPELLRKP